MSIAPRHTPTASFFPSIRTPCRSTVLRGQDSRYVLACAQQARVPSGWAEKASDGEGKEVDRLANLGRAQNYNINVDHGQTSTHLDSLFTGGFLGTKADISDGSLRHEEFRTYNNIVGDYYVAPRFLMRVAMHTAKNYLADHLRSVKIPLILGIWGPKGTGKTFQTELAYKKMKMESVVMSAGARIVCCLDTTRTKTKAFEAETVKYSTVTSLGELESDVAGRPGQLIRSRYRKAADMSKVRGVMSALLVNDIDAGLGRFEGVQCTVNNQIVVSTLMNMCDHPNHVSIGEVWRPERMNIRIPVFVTGNDFSTLYAPLVRDGRMDKSGFLVNLHKYCSCTHRMTCAFQRLGFNLDFDVTHSAERYKDDHLSYEDISKLIQRFGNQTLDFFGAIRAGTYDSQILDWIKREVVAEDITEDGNLKKISDRLLRKSDLPQFEPVNLDLDILMEEGDRLVYEQEMVNNLRLSDDYIIKQHGSGSMLGFS